MIPMSNKALIIATCTWLLWNSFFTIGDVYANQNTPSYFEPSRTHSMVSDPVPSLNKYKYPIYLGITGGYGWTTWGGLVPPKNKQNFATNMSTPTYINEGGTLWGVFAGYEFLPYFALEGAYVRSEERRVGK